jgi:hypothetical protein
MSKFIALFSNAAAERASSQERAALVFIYKIRFRDSGPVPDRVVCFRTVSFFNEKRRSSAPARRCVAGNDVGHGDQKRRLVGREKGAAALAMGSSPRAGLKSFPLRQRCARFAIHLAPSVDHPRQDDEGTCCGDDGRSPGEELRPGYDGGGRARRSDVGRRVGIS